MNILIICGVIFILLILFIILESHRELNMIKLKEYDYPVKDDFNALKGKCFIFLSDYHEAAEGKLNDRIIKMVKEKHPEFILIGGDMINGLHSNENVLPSVDLIERLSEITNIYMASGNHEMKLRDGLYDSDLLWEKYYSSISEKVCYLTNEKAEISTLPVSIFGLDLEYKYYRRMTNTKLDPGHITQLIDYPDEDRLNILLAHNPEYFDSYSKWAPDIILSGHYHGGIIRIPFIGGVVSPKLKPFPKYTYGCFKNDKSTMYVTNGIGQHSLKIRINNIPEVVCVNFI